MKPVDAIVRSFPIIMAACSLVSLYTFTQIDTLVHGTLYAYGLQFSNDWATQYWTITRIYVAMGWTGVILAGATQVYLLARKPPANTAELQQTELREDDRWSTFRLGDGSTIKVKLVVKGAKRLNKFSPDGMPIYTVETEPVVRVVDVPETLKISSSS